MKKILHRFIPLLQILGGLTALVMTFDYLYKSFSIAVIPIISLVLIIFALGVAGGVLLWQNFRLGAVLSVVHQILIVPVVSIPNVLIYEVRDIIGIDFGKIKFGDDDKINFGFKMSTDYSLHIYPQTENLIIQINVLAVFIIVYLLKNFKTLDRLVREPRMPNPAIFD